MDGRKTGEMINEYDSGFSHLAIKVTYKKHATQNHTGWVQFFVFLARPR